MGDASPGRGRLFVVSAPSGAGKTSLTHAWIKRLAASGGSARFSVSYTTRKPRPGETDGVDYHFVDDARFLQMIDAGDFLEHAEVFGRRYGTGRHETEKWLSAGHHVVLDIDWQGARQVRRLLGPEATTTIFIRPPSLEELARRLRDRGQDSDESIAHRLSEAEKDISHADEYDHVVVNDDFDRAVEALLQLFRQPQLENTGHLA
ncbi:MAG: guanylate kinase [Salinisphaeraceae bacterium]|jgi:guanylate kinase|nr:guanylate kinase [Salinisphaeraceae bacterium]